MKTPRINTLVALAVVLGAGLWAGNNAWAAHCGGATGKPCTENIRETKHNLAANTDILSTGTSEVCVFCHTPHGGRTDVAGGGAPLWNRALPPSNQFTNYTSPNFDNQLGVESAGPKGVSLACLSCHDGTIALDALINAPGSGGFNPANRNPLTGTSAGTHISTLTFNGPGVDGSKSLNEGERPAMPTTPTDPQQGFLGGLNDFVGGPGMEPFPNLGRNLTDDHPISVRMPSTDPQFDDALGNSPTYSAGGNVRYVQRAGAQLPPDPRDRIRLYNSGNDGTGTTIDWVECASCHNPHTPRTTFLRLPSTPAGVTAPGDGDVVVAQGATRNLNHEPNQGSLICLTCHQK